MRGLACSLVLVFAVCVVACGGGKTPTSGPEVATPGKAGAPGKGAPAGKDLGLPWSEGTANQKLKGLTDDEVEALIGKPDDVGRDPNRGAGDRTLWRYPGKWIKPNPPRKGVDAVGMFVVFKNGKVIEIQVGNG